MRYKDIETKMSFYSTSYSFATVNLDITKALIVSKEATTQKER